MSPRKIICPFDRAVLAGLRGRELCVRTPDPGAVVAARDAVAESGNALMCVVLDLDAPLDRLEVREEWRGIPLAVMASAVGRFRGLAQRAPSYRELNLRVFLPETRENVTGARILASVGIPCGLLLAGGATDWDALGDLATYAILERVAHAPIEPFAYIAAHYVPNAHTPWGAACFDDPARFLHMSDEGQVAASRAELLAGRFLGTLAEAESEAGEAALAARGVAWKRLFFDDPVCSSCAGFRVCMGRVPRDAASPPRCAAFFSELMDTVETFREQRPRPPEEALWQL